MSNFLYGQREVHNITLEPGLALYIVFTLQNSFTGIGREAKYLLFMRVPEGEQAYNVSSYHTNNTAQKTPCSIINNPQSTVPWFWYWQCFLKLDQKGTWAFFLTWCLSKQGKNSVQLLDATDLRNLMIKRNCAFSILRAILLESYEVERNFRFSLYPLGNMTSLFFWQFHYAW